MKSILKKLAKLMSVRMLAIALTFVQTIVMTRVFGSEVFGLLSFALSISALAVLLLSAGLDQVLMRDIARIGKDKVASSERWQSIWRLVKRLVLPLTLSVSVLGMLVVATTELAGPYKTTVLAALLMLPLVLTRKYLEAMCLGTKQVVRSITGSQLAYPVLMILVAGSIWWLGVTPDAKAVSLTYSLAILGSLIASTLLIVGTLRQLRNPSAQQAQQTEQQEAAVTEEAAPDSKALLKSGVHFSLISLGFVLSQHIDVLLVGILATPEDVAMVRIASRVAEMAGLMRAIIVLQYKPLIAEAFGKENLTAISRNAHNMVKLFSVTGIPIVLCIMLFAEQFMAVFGPEFVAGAQVLRVFSIGVLVTLILGPGNTVLSLTGFEHVASRNLMIALAVQVLLDLILIPTLGALGCAIANMTALIVLSVINAVSCKRSIGISPTIFHAVFNKQLSTT